MIDSSVQTVKRFPWKGLTNTLIMKIFYFSILKHFQCSWEQDCDELSADKCYWKELSKYHVGILRTKNFPSNLPRRRLQRSTLCATRQYGIWGSLVIFKRLGYSCVIVPSSGFEILKRHTSGLAYDKKSSGQIFGPISGEIRLEISERIISISIMILE